MKAFDFVEGDREYTCRVEEQRRDPKESWWWFGVTGDRSRYAPFRASSADTEDSVRARVLAYYDERLAPRVWKSWKDRAAERRQG